MNIHRLGAKFKKAIAGMLSVAMVLTSLTIPTTTVMAEEAAVNLISNGSFTEGVSDWTLESENWFVAGDYALQDGTWNAGSDEDNHNAYIWYNGSNDWKTQGPGCIHKSIGSLGAGVYKMSAYVNTQFPLSVDLFVASSYENYTLDAAALAGTTAGDGSYTKIEKEITVENNMPAAAAGVVLYLNDTDVSITGGNIFIDEVSLVKISDIEAPETSLKDLSDLVNGSISVNSLTVTSITENAGDDNAELYYTEDTYSAYKTALEAAKTLIASAAYAEVSDPAMTSDDDIVAAYNALYLAMSKLEVSPEPPAAQTLYFYYNHENLKEGEVLAANAWTGVVIDASAESFDIGWANPFYVLTQIYPDWWELSLNDHIAGGFGIYVTDKNSEGTKFGEYDPEWNNTELYAEIAKDENTEIAIKDGKAFANETAKALTNQVSMYVYDAANVPTLYIWAEGGEWDDKSYPLTYVDEEAGEVKELTAETDGGNHYFKFADASEDLGDNWYKLNFVADTDVSGKVFSLIGYSDAGYVWSPNTKFSYDGTADTVDASPMLEGNIYFKDGSFSASIDASLSMLRKLIDSAKEIEASGYTKESFDSMNEALSAAQTVADKYAEVSSEDSAATLGEDISQAYDNLKSAINALEKLFAADKVVHVYYYSQNDVSGLFVRPWSSVADYVKQNVVSKVGDEHPDWYTFELEMSKEAETVTDWPGFDLNKEAPDWDDSVTVQFTEFWNTLAVASKNGDSYYIKNGEVFSSFDGKVGITLSMLKELVDKAKYYAEEDFTEESYAGFAKAVKDAKELIDSGVSESTAEGQTAIEDAYNSLEEAMNGLMYKTVSDINVKKVILNDDFILGADLSSYVSIRQSGVVFKADINNDGVAEALSDQEFFNFLKEGGTNWVRIRVWNDPYDSSGNGYGGGNNDINKAITLGKLAQKAGMKILIDFHYSDFWADPSKYKSPKAWADYTNQQKADALYEFTYSSMQKLYEAGVTDIYMVQVGNESNHGLAGETDGDATILYGYGCEAVHDAASALYKHYIDTAVHVTDVQNGGGTVTSSIDRQLRNNKYKSHKDGSLQYVPYDAVGVSYYPMYNHGSIPNLKNVIKTLSASYGPGGSNTRVYVAETSWARTWLDGDGFSNSGPSISGGQDVTSYSISVQGQADEVRAVVDTVNSINADINDLTGFGVFYWEPAWLAPYQACYDDYSYDADNFAKNQAAWEKFGSGWASKYSVEYDPTDAGLYYGGVGVDNMGWFNFDGTALATAQIFKLIRSGASTGKLSVVAVEGNQKITLNVGVDSQIDDILPKTVVTYYNDGSLGETAVTWNKNEKLMIDLDEVNIYEINGKAKVDGVTYPVKLTVEIVANNTIDALKNNDFEIIEDSTSNNIKFKNWDVYSVNEDGTYVTYKSQTDGTNPDLYFNWGTNNITINNENAKGDAINGHALNFWHAESPLDVHIYQKIGTAAPKTAFIPGEYTFGGYLEGGSAGEYDKQYAVAYVYDSEAAFEADLEATKKDPVKHPLGTNAKRYKGSAKFAGWLSWQEAKVDSVQVAEGQYLVVGYEMNGSTAGAWGSVDDAYLYGSFNVNIGENTGNGKGIVTASKYVAGTCEKVKLTAKADSGYVLDSITVTGDGVNTKYFKEKFNDGKAAWSVSGNKAVYTAAPEDNENGAATIYFSMPEGDVNVSAQFTDMFAENTVDVNDSAIEISLNGKPARDAKFYANKKQIKPEVALSYKGYVLAGNDYTVKYGTNKAVGTGSIEITGKKPRFTGSRTIEFTILEESRKQITAVEFVTPDTDKRVKGYYYTGSEITFVDKSVDPDSMYAILVKDEEGNTVSANEYVLGYEKNVKVGTAKLYVNAKTDSSNYSGSVETKFKIERADIGKLIVPGDASSRMVVNDTNKIADTSYVKDGVSPSVQIWYDGTVNLRRAKDYKVSYKNNKKISTDKNKATVVITGRGNYTGKAVLTYNITASDIADQNVLVQVSDILEGASLNPRVTVMLRTSSRNKIATGNYSTAVYEIPAGLTTISENDLGAEVTRQKADATKNYAVKITGKNTFSGYIIQRLRIADKDHMVMDSSVYVGNIYYQATAIELAADGSGTLRVDDSQGKSVSVNSIKVMTKSGATTLSADQFDIYLYKQRNKDNITASGRASLYIRVKDGVVAADGKPLAGDIVKVIRVKKLHLVPLGKYEKLVAEGKATGYAAINHKSADEYTEITNETNLYDVMDEDTAYGREQYYTGYKKTPGYTGASQYSEGLKVCMNGSKATMPFIDYTLTYTNNVKPAVVSKDGSGITYGGENKEDPVALSYVKGSGATANFTGTNNFFGAVKFLDAFYIHPRTIDDLEVIPVSTVGYTGKTSYKETKYVKFMDPRYGVEDFMKPGVAYRLTVKNIKKVAGISSQNAPEATLVTKNGLIGTGDRNTIKWNFALAACKINESNTTVMEIKTQKYRGGQAVTPKVKVYVGKKALMEGRDYILEYSNNFERCSTTDAAGFTYENAPKVKIIGIGNYTGEISRYFGIE